MHTQYRERDHFFLVTHWHLEKLDHSIVFYVSASMLLNLIPLLIRRETENWKITTLVDCNVSITNSICDILYLSYSTSTTLRAQYKTIKRYTEPRITMIFFDNISWMQSRCKTNGTKYGTLEHVFYRASNGRFITNVMKKS